MTHKITIYLPTKPVEFFNIVDVRTMGGFTRFTLSDGTVHQTDCPYLLASRPTTNIEPPKVYGDTPTDWAGDDSEL